MKNCPYLIDETNTINKTLVFCKIDKTLKCVYCRYCRNENIMKMTPMYIQYGCRIKQNYENEVENAKK